MNLKLNKYVSGQGEIPYRRYSPRAERHDLVRFQSRQYSLDGRNELYGYISYYLYFYPQNVCAETLCLSFLFLCEFNHIHCLFSTFIVTNRKCIKISYADGHLLQHTILFLTKYAVPHISVLNSYVYSNIFSIQIICVWHRGLS